MCFSSAHSAEGTVALFIPSLSWSFRPAFPGQPPSALQRSSMGKGSCTQGQPRVTCVLTQDWAAFTLCFALLIPHEDFTQY